MHTCWCSVFIYNYTSPLTFVKYGFVQYPSWLSFCILVHTYRYLFPTNNKNVNNFLFAISYLRIMWKKTCRLGCGDEHYSGSLVKKELLYLSPSYLGLDFPSLWPFMGDESRAHHFPISSLLSLLMGRHLVVEKLFILMSMSSNKQESFKCYIYINSIYIQL